MKRGRHRLTRSCPLCSTPLSRLGHSAFFRCPGCKAPFILEGGQLRQTRGRRGRIAGVKVETKAKTRGGYLTADGFEDLAG